MENSNEIIALISFQTSISTINETFNEHFSQQSNKIRCSFFTLLFMLFIECLVFNNTQNLNKCRLIFATE